MRLGGLRQMVLLGGVFAILTGAAIGHAQTAKRSDEGATLDGFSLSIPPAEVPSLLSAVRIDGPLDFCGEAVPVDDPDVRERYEKEMLLILWDRAQVILYLKRTGRYMPYIEKMLRENGMPEDLKYMAVAESALLPHVGSSKGAVGYWQFIRSTGRNYGLRIDRHMDDRRNVFHATRAAIRYLAKLHGDFDSWTLAAAAYNMGEAGLQSCIEAQKTRDYYHLYLPLETQRYLFRILVIKQILSDPARYGFPMSEADYYPPRRFDTVVLKLDAPAEIMHIAEAAGTYYKTIKDLNPEIRGSTLMPGEHAILIPQGATKTFHAKFGNLKTTAYASARQDTAQPTTHVVRKGESLSRIAQRYQVPLSDLLRWNGLTLNRHIHPGQRLIIRQ